MEGGLDVSAEEKAAYGSSSCEDDKPTSNMTVSRRASSVSLFLSRNLSGADIVHPDLSSTVQQRRVIALRETFRRLLDAVNGAIVNLQQDKVT